MTPDIAVARGLLAAQPFSRLLGARLSRFEAGVAELTIPLGDHLRQQHGAAHGGALSYAADTALTFAAGSVAGDAVLTSEMKINYLRGARGDELIARAEVVHAGSTLVTVRCEVFDRGGDRDGERLCAVALGTVARR
ncbi:phenylacetic acid degradation protein [Frankia sp. CcI156]|uniref:Phenylacetic acid degradation-related protein n=1 Tax=Frankia casuarinae (strain DSM 45818 / CECT 9043 / HFP020203 / CcI3) TaxID=106370 RepID=Q2JAV3_FRACC|nr:MULTISPECIES: PaaI family thioesterase [Frankia]ABD11589.1 Phenylacetic acid degradation-related protein [Frankia casuarinae]ETA01191.1 uncharacterized protein, possibly involved in aromatic compounds catabolism [Frankia sp. CcI6]EYT91644.1 uncharacterized protein, possibly involved in aromatic compounds catabolism [Frankia casuarinae]KDA41237.1 uncharacterized protein, possibly involved in aromatic compounds catabolism [Frankia sp. BMG5.23]OFB41982.1 phenylacetic acid degradation protein [